MTATARPTAETAALFHALSDPTRLQILRCLASCERCVCDLTEALDASQPRLSFHLKVLRQAGLVSDRRSGRWVYYTLNREVLEEASRSLTELSASLSPDAGACCG
jgi:ArsR family transcriptional regulator, arsenate/arsenite/antimonite-responsive transcriptional repressor